MSKLGIKGFIAGFLAATVGMTTLFAAGGIKSATFNSNKVIFDGRELNLGGQPLISVVKDGEVNASNYMPVRGVLEAMGYNVNWDGERKAVIVSSKGTAVMPTPANRVVVGFVQMGAESDWRVSVTNSVKQACMDAGFELMFVDAQGEQDNQIKALRDFITQGVDYIAFTPIVESGWEQVMKEIKDAGIPVIMLDRNIDMPNREGYYATWIGSSFIEEGKKAGDWLVSYMEKEGRGKDQINIVELKGTVGSSPANDRQKGFYDAIAVKSNFKITQSQTGNFETELGKVVMESMLLKAKTDGTKIDVVYAHNDGMALGAIQAIKEAGLKPGEDIIIVSIDAIKLAFEAIIAGEMNVSVECSPVLGPQLVQAIKDLEAEKVLPKITYTNEGVYDEYFYKNAIKELPNRTY